MSPRNNRILIIDDNPAIHKDFRKILSGQKALSASWQDAKAALFDEKPAVEEEGFQLESASQGKEGVEKLEAALAAGCPYALAFVDVRMPPGWDGVETISRLWQVYPELQVVICTAYSDYSWDQIVKQLGRSDNLVILKKPFDNIEVLQLAHALTEKWMLAEKAKARLEDLDRMVRQRTSDLQAANTKLQQEMAERLSLESQLRQAQKMEAIGQLAAGIAHDFNNLLTIIQGHVSLRLAAKNMEKEVLDSLQQVAVATERAASLTRQLLAFSSKQVVLRKVLDLNQVIRRMQQMLVRIIGEQISLECDWDEALPAIEADESSMEQILMNLVVNARDAMAGGGKLTVQTRAVMIEPAYLRQHPEAHAGPHICLTVTDTGCGMEPVILGRIFEPFFTTKAVGKGTGLGLATVYGIAKQHDGWIEVDSAPGQGSTFRIFLPASRKARQAHPEKPSGVRTLRGSERVLIVEDEPLLRELVHVILRQNGYTVHDASNGVEALKLWRTHSGGFDLLVTDLVMPQGITGHGLAQQLKAERPDLKILFTSGYSSDMIDKELHGNGQARFLQKPYKPELLLRVVRETLELRAALRA